MPNTATQKQKQSNGTPMAAGVTFGTVQIREYPNVLSNNPTCHYGPSIELAWQPANEKTYSAVSDFEKQTRSQRRSPRPTKPRGIYLSQVARETILKNCQKKDDESNDRSSCYSDEDIRAAIRQKHKDRMYRSINNALRSPVARIGDARRIMRTEKKVKRAIRNLHKQRNGDNTGDGSNASNTTPCHDELYKGWWLPFSAYIFWCIHPWW